MAGEPWTLNPDRAQATSLVLILAVCWRHGAAQDPSKRTWPGLSTEALTGWGAYLRMAAPSMVMICERRGEAFQ